MLFPKKKKTKGGETGKSESLKKGAGLSTPHLYNTQTKVTTKGDQSVSHKEVTSRKEQDGFGLNKGASCSTWTRETDELWGNKDAELYGPNKGGASRKGRVIRGQFQVVSGHYRVVCGQLQSL